MGQFYAIPLAQEAYSVFANHINNYFKECACKQRWWIFKQISIRGYIEEIRVRIINETSKLIVIVSYCDDETHT